MSLAIESLFQKLWKELSMFDENYDQWLARVSKIVKNLQALVYIKIGWEEKLK